MTAVRLREKERIVKAITSRKSLVVHGATGMGKSYLIQEVLNELNDKSVLYSPDCTSLKRMLLGFLQPPYPHTLLKNQNTLELKNIFFKTLKSELPYLIIDHIGNITSRYCSFVQSLARYTSLLIVTRSLYLREMKDLAIVTVRFDTLEIAPLTRNESYRLLDHLIGLLKIGVPDVDGFKKAVYLFSKGNPMAIHEICSYAKNDKYLVKGETNFKLLNLDRKIDEFTRKGISL